MPSADKVAPPWIQWIFAGLTPLSPELAGRFAKFLWYRTVKHSTWTRDEAITMQASRNVVHAYNKGSIQVYEWGHGPAVLLVHGWNGYSSQMAPLAESLTKQGYRIIVFDAPGHGRSSGRQTDLLEISGFIQQLARGTGELAAVISHSFGGMCALKAIADGLNTKAIVCISAPQDITMLVEPFIKTLKLHESVTCVFKRLLEQRFGNDVWNKFSIVEWVKSADMPGLLIHDTKDRFVSVNSSRQIHQAWANSEYLETSGLGHSKILKDNDVIHQITRFINKCNSPTI